MTASKSSRARNARAGAKAGTARNAGRGGTAVTNGTAGRSGSAARNAGAAKGGSASRTGSTGPDGEGAQVRTAAPRNGTAARNGTAPRGARTQVVQDSGERGGPGAWLQLTTFALALAGLGVSIYLTIAHFTDTTLAGCKESGLVNCTKVTTSPQSYVFGIPVAVLGLAFFVFLAAIMSPWAWQAARREIHLLRIASLVVGIGFVLYLIYAELLIIGSICLYCTSVHAITFVLFALTVIAAAIWGLKPGTAWKPRLTRMAAAD